MIKSWTDDAWEDLEYWMEHDKKTLRKIKKLLKWNEKNGLVSKSYKLQKEIADAFSETCERVGVSQKSQIEKMMMQFVKENEPK